MAGVDNLTPWKKGQSGNPAGKKPGTKNIKTIMQQLVDLPKTVNEVDGLPSEVSRLEFICAKLVNMAENGDLASIDRVFDRLEGKPEQVNKNTNNNANVDVSSGDLAELPDEALEEVMGVILKYKKGEDKE